MRVEQLLISLSCLAVAGIANGCTNLQNASALSGTGNAVVTSATQSRKRFDPFTDDQSTSSPLREVIKNPTVAQIMKPGPLPEMSLGRPDAPVTMIKYASLTCPYCRKFQIETFPVLKRTYIDTGKVRFILREFPIGFQSGAATIALRCAPASKYFRLYDKFLRQQRRWVSQEVRTGPIFDVVRQVGITRAQYDACRKNQLIIKGLKAIKDRGRTLGVIGTPNFFVDGRLIKSVLTMSDIRAIVEAKLAGNRRTAKPKALEVR